MNCEIFEIPCYKIDEDVDLGHYLFLPELDGITSGLLDRLVEGRDILVEIPRLKGALLAGRLLGDGLELTALLDGDTWLTAFLAIDKSSSKSVRQAAQSRAAAFGWSSERMHPEWKLAMKRSLRTPFSVIVPNLEAVAALGSSREAVEKMQATTGFIQTVMSSALKRSGQKSSPLSDEWIAEFKEKSIGDRAEEGQPQGVDFAAAMQTGGVPHNKLIVAPGNGDEYPEVYAHIMDLEIDVFRVDFHLDDTMTLNPEGMGYLTLDRDVLDLISALAEQAEQVWTEARSLLREHEDMLAEMTDPEAARNLPDPLTHLYTHHPKVEVPPEVAEHLKSGLGLRSRGHE